MVHKIIQVVWTRNAREALNSILDYRFKEIPSARKIVRRDIISASKNIVFAKQYQKDNIDPKYHRIIIRDYKILYKSIQNTIYIMNIVCTKASR